MGRTRESPFLPQDTPASETEGGAHFVTSSGALGWEVPSLLCYQNLQKYRGWGCVGLRLPPLHHSCGPGGGARDEYA